MKIEICEQMAQSWLQHCKQCEIVQTNWSISPLREITDADIDDVSDLMKEVQEQLNQHLDLESKSALQESVDEEYVSEENIASKKKSRKSINLNIFKKNKASQFIRQCEIDVVGCKLDDGITDRIYLVDTAFHKDGLGYHDVVATVAKKLIRALVVSAIVFGESVSVSVIFASPKCGDKSRLQIEAVADGLRKFLASHPKYSNIEIELYFNERFATEMYLPLISEIKELNNDNDLFMRAMNLAKIANEKLPSGVTAMPKPSTASTGGASSTVTMAKTPRGQNQTIVFDILKDIISSGKMTPALLNDLRTPDFAKIKFRLSTFPVLVKEADFAFSGYERHRFYNPSIKIAGDKYLVCSQWIPERIAKLQDWHKAL